ncbi:MAG: glycosyltransferase [Candidatus Bathyarchaeia archaeon]|jgi:glycosyltransferase involved in cell wall biosynthesis
MVSVSVLMGSYNHELYLAEAIESVLNQTFSDLELIIIDDCSSDASKDIIRKYQERDSRVKPIFHSQNTGIARAMNDGLKEAKGEYLTFIGSDDLWLPFKLEKQLEVIKRHEDEIIWSEGQIINAKGESTGQLMTQFLFSPKKRTGNLFQELLYEDFIFGQSVMLKTRYAQEIGFDEKYQFVNDHMFFVSQSRKHNFVFIPQTLAKYRLHGKNTTLRHSAVWFKERIALRKSFLMNYASEISQQALADIYYKIGHAYSGLKEKQSAKHFYLKAINADPLRSHTLLFLILALTNGEGFLGTYLADSYRRVTSYFMF